MTLKVIVSDAARKELGRMDRAVAARVLNAVYRYANTGYGDVKAMKGKPGEYRLRVGDWRVRFALDPTRGELVVQHVLNRREAYRD